MEYSFTSESMASLAMNTSAAMTNGESRFMGNKKRWPRLKLSRSNRTRMVQYVEEEDELAINDSIQ